MSAAPAPVNLIKLGKSSEFPTVLGNTQEYPDTDQAFVGTYDGVDGKFDCVVGAACSVRRNANGSLSLVSGGLVFTPDDPSDMVTVADGEYLYLGFWLHKPDKGRRRPQVCELGRRCGFVQG